MDPARYQHVKRIFNAAATLSSSKRINYLDMACGDDRELRAEVEALLANDDEADTFLSAPAVQGAWLAPETQAFSVGQTIGPYTLEAVLGEGGMGTVFLAQQAEPVRRKVALKLLKRVSPNAEEAARFELERQVLAMLAHSGIAKILDAGQTQDGHPFYVMEHVQGDVLTEFCDREQLTIPQRIDLFLQVCDAVDYAHKAGIIHRDLKPSNVLVKWENQRAIATIIDFGIAKGLETTLARSGQTTQHGTILGTPAYMSPEQAKGGLVNTATDVYALGVMLYGLLCGRLPLDMSGKSLYAMLERVIEAKPLSMLQRVCEAAPDNTVPTTTALAERRGLTVKAFKKELASDLECIVAKALQKQPEARYGSAHEFASDLRNFLKQRPVSAHQPMTWQYRANLWRKRHKALFGGIMIAASALTLGVVLALWGFFQAVEFGRKASFEAAKANAINSFLLSMLGTSNTYEGGRDIQVIEALDYAVDRLDREHFEDPRIEMGIRLAIAETYAYTNRLQAAQTLLEDSLPRAQTRLGAEARETMEIEIGLAFIRAVRGEYAPAEAVFRRMLPIFESRYGLEDETTLFLYSCLINVLTDQERFQEALNVATPVYQAMTLAIADAPELTQHVEVLDFMTQYAVLLDLNQQTEPALALMEQVVAWKTNYYGTDHNDTLFTKTQYALMQLPRDPSQITNLQQRLLPKLIERFGSDNISAASAAASFVAHLLRQQRMSSAAPFANMAYQALLEQLGYQHRETFAAERQWCHVLWGLGEVDLLRDILDQRACIAAPADLNLWRHLAHFYLRLGELPRTAELLQQGLEDFPQDPELQFYAQMHAQAQQGQKLRLTQFQKQFPDWQTPPHLKEEFQQYILD